MQITELDAGHPDHLRTIENSYLLTFFHATDVPNLIGNTGKREMENKTNNYVDNAGYNSGFADEESIQTPQKSVKMSMDQMEGPKNQRWINSGRN